MISRRETTAMTVDMPDRRRFLNRMGIAAGGTVLLSRGSSDAIDSAQGKLDIACNQYPWTVYYQLAGRNYDASLDTVLQDVARSGINGYEPLSTSPVQIDQLGPLLRKNGLAMRSLYVNSVLHRADEADRSIGLVMEIAAKARALGTTIIVTNPSPIRWGGPENKTDDQLKVQAGSLERLGRQLNATGMKLAYHNHDIELRNAAREFHHMMVGTDPKYVALCLDAHWIYRGSGNSSVALFDVIELYGHRAAELHLRQSVNNVWTETFGDGDIDYRAVAKRLLARGVRPHLVLEQAVEQGSMRTLDPVEAHRRSCEYAREVFAGFAAA
jgi:inosose dehydratase